MSAVRSLTVPLPLLWTGDVPVVTTPDHLLPHDALGSFAAQSPQSGANRRNRFPTHWSRRMPYREKMSPIDHSEN